MKKAERGLYKIIKNEEISPGIFELCVSAPEIVLASTAGQFVNIYLPDKTMLLPRPISIADACDKTLMLVYASVGKGTLALTDLGAGKTIEIMGPLGNGFFDYEGNILDELPKATGEDRFSVLLIGGGVGIPPLYFAAKKIKMVFQERVNIICAIGFRDEPWYEDEFKRVCDQVYIVSETEGKAQFTGNVVTLLEETKTSTQLPILALTCGPRPMLKAVSEWCKGQETPLRISMEERMGCGYGACAGCSMCGKKVCTDGPVFWADEIIW